MSSKELLVAVDRSPSKKLRITIYSIVASPITCQGVLAELRDKFKETRLIPRSERRTYFTSRVKTINNLVNENHITLLEVSKHLHNITKIAEKVSSKVIIAVVDDPIYSVFTGTFSNTIPEGKLKHTKIKGVSTRTLDTLRLIADNTANYVRIKLEEGKKMIEAKQLLPITRKALGG